MREPAASIEASRPASTSAGLEGSESGAAAAAGAATASAANAPATTIRRPLKRSRGTARPAADRSTGPRPSTRSAAATLRGVTVRSLVTPEEAVSRIRDGDVIMVGGFGLVGAPLTLIDALVETSGARDLTIVSNNVGEAGRGLGKLLRQGRIRKAIASYFTSNPEAVAAAQAGELEYELLPQGTLAEAIRAGGAGLGGFYTPVGAGTDLADRQGGAGSSTACRTCSSGRSRRTSRWSTRPAATSSATSGTGARRATSTPRW